MAGHLAVVTAKTHMKGHGKGQKHKHPVRRMTITPTDNGGFMSEAEMHPTDPKGSKDMYMPGETKTAAHQNFAQMHKHVKDMLKLKTDAEEQGEGEMPGGNPGDNEDAE